MIKNIQLIKTVSGMGVQRALVGRVCWEKNGNPHAVEMICEDEESSLLAALSHCVSLLVQDVAPTWQPIQTAPKDQIILIYIPSSEETFIAYWSELSGPPITGGGWAIAHDYGDGHGSPDTSSATHWMPLPPPPTK